MRKEIPPEEKLQASLNKIERVFFRMMRSKISVRKEKGMSDKTAKTYADLMKSITKKVYEQTGKADITKFTEKDLLKALEDRVENYRNGSGKEAYNIKAIRSAVKAFSKGAQETGIFKHQMRFDGQKIDKMITEEKIVRKAKESSTLKATTKQTEKVIRNIESSGYQTDTRKIAAASLKIAQYAGARITSSLKLRPEDIIELEDKVVVWFLDGKGGKDDKVVIYDEEHQKFFKELKESGHPGQPILKSKRKDGTFKKTEQLRTEVAKIVREAGKEFDTKISVREQNNGVRKSKQILATYSVHAARKTFTNERIKIYWDRLKNETFEDIMRDERPEEFEKIMKKYDTELQKINGNKYSTKKQTELTREQASILATSISTNHYRIGILKNYYLDMPSFKKYQQENP